VRSDLGCPSIETRGASKSNASRALIDATTEKLAQFTARKLDDVDLVAMFIDGIEFAGHAVLIALGVTIDGTKTPLGGLYGKHHRRHRAAVQSRRARPARRAVDAVRHRWGQGDPQGTARRLWRSRGRAALSGAQGSQCPRPPTGGATRVRRQADPRRLHSATAATAKKKLLQLASWLDCNGHDDAAVSLREGLEETLTVMRLGLTGTLRRTFAITNAIENMNGSRRSRGSKCKTGGG
jgi:putative transposase